VPLEERLSYNKAMSSPLVDPNARSLSDFYTQTAIPNAPKHTGRLPLSGDEEKSTLPPYRMTAQEPYVVPSRVAEQMQYRHESTPLNTIYFSESNLANLQAEIASAVLQMSGTKRYVIGPQSEADLKTVMRSYYLQYGQNDPSRVSEELTLLNNRVIGWCANNILVQIEAYKYYRKDIEDFPAPIERPVMTNIYGTRTGELRSFF
jgi:hypothetical protein